jgi:tetratricopeptide (TPR) repeat protein
MRKSCLWLILTSLLWAQPASLSQAEEALLKKRYGLAEKYARQVLQAEPNNLLARKILSQCALTRRDALTARYYAHQIQELQPEDGSAFCLLGMAALLEGVLPEATSNLQKGLELSTAQGLPGDEVATAANSLMVSLHLAGQAEEAVQVGQTYLTQYPEAADLYVTLNRVLRELGRPQMALEVAQQGLRQCPQHAPLLGSLALSQAALGQKKEAEEAYLRLKAKQPELAKVVRQLLDSPAKTSAPQKGVTPRPNGQN